MFGEKMNYKKIKMSILLSSILLLSIFPLILSYYPSIFHVQEKTNNFQNLKFSAIDFTNATVISDGFNGIYWSDDDTDFPAIVTDNSGKIHVVWEDDENGVWGTDTEIMYVSYTEATGWSNITVISDGYIDVYWNIDDSQRPSIAVDGNNNIHVVWHDMTDGVWGTDTEIMYVSYTEATGWSNITVISDGYGGIYWNDGESMIPSIAVDGNNNIHVVWHDNTIGVWGGGLLDTDIMYVKYTEATGWSNITVISDGYGGIYWNDGTSAVPEIALDSLGGIHVVWEEYSYGVWGGGSVDTEIMYVDYTQASGWSNISVISDVSDIYWNTGISSYPDIVVDKNDKAHVVWHDGTVGVWGPDYEIMYSTLGASGWSFPIVISDGHMGVYWNDHHSFSPSIAVDGLGNLHVVWHDMTDGVWGTDTEIMYTSYSEVIGWIIPKVISDRYSGIKWNDGNSYSPAIAYGNEETHIVWYDLTDGVWGTDYEIMYSNVLVDLNPTSFTLSTNAGSPDSDGLFDLIWTESGGANNYSVYNHSSYISEINSSVTLIQDGLTFPSFNLAGLTNGTYYIVIEAVNEFGSVLSNCVSIKVQLPYVPQVLQTPSGFSIPFGNFYLVISILGIIYLIVHIKRKL